MSRQGKNKKTSRSGSKLPGSLGRNRPVLEELEPRILFSAGAESLVNLGSASFVVDNINIDEDFERNDDQLALEVTSVAANARLQNSEPSKSVPVAFNAERLGDTPTKSSPVSFVAETELDSSAQSAIVNLAEAPQKQRLASFVVTTNADSGAGSLRQAILDANGSAGVDTITFNIGGGGAHTIDLLSTLPTISDEVLIDASSQPGWVGVPLIEINASGVAVGFELGAGSDDSIIRSFVINNATLHGIVVSGGSGNHIIAGNYIGTDATGNVDAGVGDYGIFITSSSGTNTIGGPGANDGNVIAGNDDRGVYITSGDNNLVYGNNIGVGADGSTALGNGSSGVTVTTNGNKIGDSAGTLANIIANHTDDGVQVLSGTANTISANSIYGNGDLAIDLSGSVITLNDNLDGDSGNNNQQNFPVLYSANTDGSSALNIAGTLNSNASQSYRIEFFSNDVADGSGHGEGQTYLGFVNAITDASGNAYFDINLSVSVAVDSSITATATSTSFPTTGDTSEFAKNVIARDYSTAVVTTASDTLDGNTTSLTDLINFKGSDGRISLREAILAANATVNSGVPDNIYFDIPESLSSGSHLLAISSALPNITNAVVIDGTTDSDYMVSPIIELSGSSAGAGIDGIRLDSGSNGSTIRGLVINQFDGDGIVVNSDDALIEDNYIGTSASGGIDLGNDDEGIEVDGDNATIRDNLVSGNDNNGIRIDGGDGNLIAGNVIGLNVFVSSTLGNGDDGIKVMAGSTNTIIGGTVPTDRNIIGGNEDDGVQLSGSGAGNKVIGNFIGTDLSGLDSFLGNQQAGIELSTNAANIQIGGLAAGEGNIIAFNDDDGIQINSDALGNNTIRGNSILSNNDLGIDIQSGTEDGFGVTENDTGDADVGPNDLQNTPVLDSISGTNESNTVTVSGTLNSSASSTFDLDFYASAAGVADSSGYGEGQVYIGSTTVNTDGSGNATINAVLTANVSDASVISATATTATGSTSEFSNNSTAQSANITGAVFSDAGTTPLGSQTVRVAINGVDQAVVGSNATTGEYSFSGLTLSNGDVITLYLEDETANAVAVTVYDGTPMAVDLYQDYLIARKEDGTALGTADLDTAQVAVESDILDIYAASSTDLILQSNTTLLIPSGHQLDTAGTSTVANVQILGTLDTGFHSLAVSGDFTTSGSFLSSGSVSFVGSANQSLSTGGTGSNRDFENFGINKTGGSVTLTGGSLAVRGILTMTSGTLVQGSGFSIEADAWNHDGGTFTGGNGLVNIDGQLTLNAGTFTATSGNTLVEGDWQNNGAVFNHNSGVVELDGSSQSVDGSNAFFDFIKATVSSDTLTFENGETTSIAAGGSLTLTGALGQLLTLESDNSFDWLISKDAGASQNVAFVDVSHSDASGGEAVIAGNSNDGGDNTNWIFTDGLEAGLVGHYKLDDASGTVATDSSLNANNGSLQGTPNPTWVDGTTNTGLDFDGTDDKVVVADPANDAFDFGAGDFSVAFWIKDPESSDTPSGFPFLVSKVDVAAGGSRQGFEFYWNHDFSNGLTFKTWTGGVDIGTGAIAGAGLGDDGEWHHVVGIRQGNTLQLYVDGALEGTQTHASIGDVNNSADLIFGDDSAGVKDTNASLDEVRFYDRALTALEIDTLVNQRDVIVDTTLDMNDAGIVDGNSSHDIAFLYDNKGADGFISLREAIIATNNTPNGAVSDRIEFNIAGNGTKIINLGSVLPNITDSVAIDGTTQTDWVAGSFLPIIVDGNNLSGDGLRFEATADESVLRGLVIRDVSSNAIQVNNGADGLTISGNFLGSFDSSGNEVVGEETSASIVFVQGATATIGGTTIADRNVIAGGGFGVTLSGPGATGNVVAGNYIGTDATGNVAVAIGGDGVRVAIGATSNTIGGLTTAHRNVIAGVIGNGVEIITETSDNNSIQNNWIGVSADGSVDLGTAGLFINDGPDNTQILDNVIADSAFAGIEIDGASSGTVIQGNFIGTNAAQDRSWGSGENGIMLESGASGNTIGGIGAGEGNVIAYSGRVSPQFGSGVSIQDTSGNNTIRGNSIYGNAGIGIDLNPSVDDGADANDVGDTDAGGNQKQNWAAINSVTANGSNELVFDIDTTTLTGGSYTVDFYASTDIDGGLVEGRRYLGTVAGVSNGATNLSSTLVGSTVAANEYITLVTTDASGDSSEFSSYAALAPVIVVVDTTSDAADGDTSDISSLLASRGADGFISLREAITAANNTINGILRDEIHFSITGAGPHIIAPTSALPNITDAVVIDGTTEPDFAGAPVIQIDGAFAGASADGLAITTGSGSTIRGLSITDFDDAGIQIDSTNNTIVGNFLGLDSSGAVDGNALGIEITGASNTVGGITTVDRNVISGNTQDGIYLNTVGASNNVITGNFIGTNVAGSADLGNSLTGIFLENGASNNSIGGTVNGARNVISGNNDGGIQFEDAGTSGNTVHNNYIGTNATGNAGIPNSSAGIQISLGANNNTVGGTGAFEGNTIAFNITDGIRLLSSAGNANEIRANSIHSNSGHGIDLDLSGVTVNDAGDLDTGPNNVQNYPVLWSARTTGSALIVDGSLNSIASTTFVLDFFANSATDPTGHGEGEFYLGQATVSTNASGNAVFSESLPVVVSAGDHISATATDPSGNTSEFALNAIATSEVLIVDTVVDENDGDTSSISALLATPGGTGISLREAITAVNNTANGVSPDEIHFSISGAGPHSIALGSALPTITETVILDAWTEPDYAGTPVIELDGSGAAGANGLAFSSGGSGSTVRGFVINQFANSGIFLSNADNVSITGNYIGTNAAGTADLGNGSSGIILSNADSNTIGGLTTAERNVISGNNSHGIDLQNGTATNTIIGNYVGTNALGTAQIGNGNWGIALSSGSNNNTIGGASANARNVVSGNTVGLDFTDASTSDNTVLGNYIGLNAAGTANIGNGNAAIVVQNSAAANSFESNVIAGGSTDGIRIDGADNTQILSNFIGTNAAGDADLGFLQEGIDVSNADGTIIGAVGQGNLISGNNSAGIGLRVAASNTEIIANLIGTNAANTAGIANSVHGIAISSTAADSRIGGVAAGESNTIRFNSGDGVSITGSGTGHSVVGNSIFANTELAIDLDIDGVTGNDFNDVDSGVNNLQNYPTVHSAITNGSTSVTITGNINTIASTNYQIHFYANSAADASGFGEGERYLGSTSVTTNISGDASFNQALSALVADGEFISATATVDLGGGSLGDTSEFAGNISATLPLPIIDLDANDSTTIGNSYVGSFTEAAGAVSAVDIDANISDTDSTTLDSLTVTITNQLDGTAEILSANTSGTTITAVYTPATGVLGLSGTDTVANYLQVLRTITYNNTSDSPDTTTRAIEFVANDGDNDGNTAQALLSITAVNDPPTWVSLDDNPTFTEGGSAIVLDSTVEVTDAELDSSNAGAGNFDGATVTLARNIAANAEDVFDFNDGSGITLLGGNLIKNGQAIASFDTATTAGELVVTFTDDNGETPTSVDTRNILRQITYENSSSNPPGSVQIDWTIDDGNVSNQGSGGAQQATGNNVVTISASNNAPVLGNNSLTILEGETVVLSAAELSATDVDDNDNALTFTVSGVSGGQFELLSNPQDLITSFTQSQIIAGQVVFVHDGGEAAPAYSIEVSDGASSDGPQAATISFTAVNDAPIIHNLGGDSVSAFNDGSAYSLDSNVLATLQDNDIPADYDGGFLQVSGSSFDGLDLIDINTSVSISLSAGISDGSVVTIGGTSVGSLSATSSSAFRINFNANANGTHVDTLLRNVTFTSTSTMLGSRTVDFTFNDNDGTVNGGTEVSDTASVQVFVAQPGNGQVNGTEDTTYTFVASDFDFTGISDDNLTDIEILGLPANGTLNYNGSAAVIGQLVSKADIDGGLLQFIPDVDDNGTPYGSFDFQMNNGKLSINVLAGEPNSYTLNGGSLTPTDAIIANVSNFGTSGTYQSAISIIAADSTIDAAYLAQGSVLFNGFVSDGNWTVAELTALDTWVQAGGVLITTSDAANYDDVSASYGLVIGGTAASTWLVADQTADIMNGPFGLVGTNGSAFSASGSISYFTTASLAPGDQVLATDSVSGEPTMVLRQLGSGWILFTSDEGIFRASMSGGGAIATANDRLAANVFAWAAEQVPASSSHTVDLNIAAVNDAPVATNLNAAETYTEDTPLNLVDVIVSDVDHTTTTVTLTLSDTAAGSLSTATSGSVTSTYNAGSAVWTASGAVSDVNTLLAGVTYTPALSYNSNFTIATSVSDGVAPAVAGTKNVTGTAVNDAPTATNLNAAQAYTEDTPLDLIDIVVTDVDNANTTVTLTVSDTTAGALSIGTSGAVTSTYNAGSGVWTASGAVADVNTLLAGVTYTPTLNYNSNFTIATSVSDGVAPAVTGTKNVTGTAVNDAPTATNLNAAEAYTEDTPLDLIDIVVSDIDNANTTVTLTLSDTTAGSLLTATSGSVSSTYNAGSGVWTASGAVADVNTLLAGVTYTPTLNYDQNFTIVTSVSDGIAPAVTGSKSVTATALNDAPTATNLNAAESYTEDTPVNLVDIVVTDVDNANTTVTLSLSDAAAGALSTATSGAVTSTYNAGTGLWSASGAVADVNTVLAGVTYTPTLNYDQNFTIVTSVSDGIAPAVTGSKSVIATALNDAPTATNLNAAESYTEDTPVNLVDIVVTDVDNANTTVTLTLSDAAAGALSTATSGAVTSTYNTGTGIWSASGVVADVNTLLAGVIYTPTLNYDQNFTIVTSVSDGIAPAVTGSKSVIATVVNDAPTATNLNAAESYTEDTPVNLADIVVTDVDNANTTVTLTLSDTTAGSFLTATSGAVTSTYNAGSGLWTASGAVADVNTLLAGVIYTPALNYNSSFTIVTSVSDGVAPAVTGTKNVTGTAVNDAPTVTNLNAAQAYTEDTPLDLIDIVVTDVDNANTTVTLTVSDTASGSLSTATSGSVTSTFNAGSGVWTASGAVVDVNTLLAGVTYTPTLNYDQNFTIATSVSDGIAPAVTGSKSVTAAAVNDVPTATNLNAAETYTEDTPLNLIDIVVTDVDNANTTVTLTLSDPAAGALSTATSGAVTSSYNSGTGVWSAAGATVDVNTLLADVTFAPALDYDQPFTIATGVDDGIAPAVTGLKSVSAIATNDAPVLDLDGDNSSGATLNDFATQFVENGGPISIIDNDWVLFDVDSPTLSGMSVTLFWQQSTETINAVLPSANISASAFTSGVPGTVDFTFTGVDSVANYRALLQSLTYENTSENPDTSPRIIQITVTDGSNPSLIATTTVTTVASNDPPTATNLNAAETYTEDTVLDLTNIVATDVDNANTTVTLTLSDSAAGSLSIATSGGVTSSFNSGTGVWTASGAVADVNTLLAGVNFNPALDYDQDFSIASSIDDGVAPVVTGVKAISAVPSNDSPVATNLSAVESYIEDTPLDLVDIVVTDVDSANVTATLTLSDASVGALSTATSGSVSASYDVDSGVWMASGAVSDVNALLGGVVFVPSQHYNADFSIATSVSDGVAPAVTGVKSVTGTAVNDSPLATNLNTDENYSEDIPHDLLDIVVTDVDHANVLVTLTLSDPLAGAFNIGTAGTVSSTYNAATGVWQASGLTADVNLLLAGLVFTPAENVSPDVDVYSSISDGVAAPVTGSKTLFGTAINDSPVVVNLNASETFVEDTPLSIADIVISDIDSNTVSVTLALSNIDAGQLSTATVGANTSVFDSATGVWSATGSITEVNALLVDVVFTPAADFSEDFNLITTVSDGIDSIAGTKLMTNVAVNDAPIVTNLTTAETYTEDTALLLTPIIVTDVDSPNITVTLTLSEPGIGTLAADTSGLLVASFDSDTGVWRASGAIDDVNDLLASIVFTPFENENRDVTLTVSVSDGIVSPVIGEKLITGVAINDAPVGQGEQFDLIENGVLQIDTASLLSNDSDIDSTELALVLVDEPQFGQLLVNDDGTLFYQPAEGFVGRDFFTYRVSDGDLSSELQTVEIIVQDDGAEGVVITESEKEKETPEEEEEEEKTSSTLPEVALNEQTTSSDFEEDSSSFSASLPQFALRTPTVEQSFASNIASVEFGLQEVMVDDESARQLLGSGLRGIDLNLDDLELFFADDDLWRDLDKLEQMQQGDKILVQTVMGSSAVLSTGIVAWVLRGGSLLASLLTTLPAWRSFDPLPIMKKKDSEEEQRREEDRSVDEMFE